MTTIQVAAPNRLVRNSVLLLLAQIAAAGFGFLFWLVIARIFPASQVGIASSLLSAISLLAFVSMAGMNGTLIRFLRTGHARDRQVGQALTVVVATSAIVSVGYVLLAPGLAADLAVLHDPRFAVLFVLVAVSAGVNLLTDAIFVGLRSPEYNLALDGILQGVTKLLAPLALLGVVPVVAVFGSAGLGFAVAAAASLIVLRRRFGIRPAIGRRPAFSRRELHYSVASYLSSVLNLLPSLALPMIVLAEHGAAAAAYFFMSFQIANLLYAISFAAGEATFSEGSHALDDLPQLLRTSLRLLAYTQVPAAMLVIASASWVLGLFGGEYREQATGLLVVFALGAVPVAVNAWASFVLRILARNRMLIATNASFVVVTLGLSVAFAPMGLVGFGWAWFVGNLAAAAVACAGVWRCRGRVAAIAAELA